MRIRWMLGFQRRGLRLWEKLTFMPKPGRLPQMSQTTAMSGLPFESGRAMAPGESQVQRAIGAGTGSWTPSKTAVRNPARVAAERFAVGQGWGVAAAELVLEMPSVAVGPPNRVAEELQAIRDRYGFSYLIVADDDMEAFAPVVDRLAGT
jgi:hypothetical protein